MDLISREAVANYVDNMPSELTEDGRRMIRGIRIKEFIADCPSAFEGMTNGEIIKALFPNVGTSFSNVFDLNLWWNAPYQKGGKEV